VARAEGQLIDMEDEYGGTVDLVAKLSKEVQEARAESRANRSLRDEALESLEESRAAHDVTKVRLGQLEWAYEGYVDLQKQDHVGLFIYYSQKCTCNPKSHDIP
jgi:hypothetical protein